MGRPPDCQVCSVYANKHGAYRGIWLMAENGKPLLILGTRSFSVMQKLFEQLGREVLLDDHW